MTLTIKEVQNMINNIKWHIENNRGVLGDEKTLNQVYESLKYTSDYIKRSQKDENN